MKKIGDKILGAVTEKILEIIEGSAYATSAVFDIFFTDYATSYRRLRRLDPLRRPHRHTAKEEKVLERERFYKMLSRLKEQGLITKKMGRWYITNKGNERKKKFLMRQRAALPSRDYHAIASAKLRLVIFDIPETEKRKREWLRAALRRLGFQPLQKSVWVGNIALPEEFLHDLRKLGLLPYVEIFAVTKRGSLKKKLRRYRKRLILHLSAFYFSTFYRLSTAPLLYYPAIAG